MKEDTTKILVTCPVCGYQEEVEDFNKDNEICTHCGKKYLYLSNRKQYSKGICR